MKKLEEKSRFMQPPDIDSMYAFLFYCLEVWKNTDITNSNNSIIDPRELPPFSKISPACKYAIIVNAYSILDAVIHTYVLFNGFETESQEDDISVYSKWKNFPYVIEKKSFKKADIQIIDDIRILRNDIAHPKAYAVMEQDSKPSGRGLELRPVHNEEQVSYLNLEDRPRFSPENAFFLVNEVTRLLTLASKELSNTPFIPEMKIRSNKSGEKWSSDVLVN